MKNGASLSMRPALFIDPIFRKRDKSRKYVHDPLTSITKQLAVRSSVSMSSLYHRLLYRRKRTVINLQKYKLGYLASPQSERALELIRRKKPRNGRQRKSQVLCLTTKVMETVTSTTRGRFRDRRWDRGRGTACEKEL